MSRSACVGRVFDFVFCCAFGLLTVRARPPSDPTYDPSCASNLSPSCRLMWLSVRLCSRGDGAASVVSCSRSAACWWCCVDRPRVVVVLLLSVAVVRDCAGLLSCRRSAARSGRACCADSSCSPCSPAAAGRCPVCVFRVRFPYRACACSSSSCSACLSPCSPLCPRVSLLPVPRVAVPGPRSPPF